MVPIAGGDSDIGVGVGQLSSWARLDPGPDLYIWRAETGAFLTFNLRDGDLILPYQDFYVLLSRPDLGPGERVRIDVRASYTRRTTLKFFGLGNASVDPRPAIPDDDAEYGRVHPTFWIRSRVRIDKTVFVQVGSVTTLNWLDVRQTSVLAQMQSGGSPEIRALLGAFDTHAVQLFEMGLVYDSRDNEIVTRKGAFHSLTARLSPSAGDWLPYGYQQVNGTLRFYLAPIPRWLMIAWRGVADVLTGDPPFYELERFEETSAIGGAKGVRGVPAQRYYGKVKLFQNLEARSELWGFRVLNKAFVLGAALFFDAGRVWTELGRSHPALDGSGLGLKYGIGGGIRLQQGETFVARADIAWSPDARPVGAYFAAGEVF